MDEANCDDKSCGPQLFISSEPNVEWGVNQLGAVAMAQHQQIVESERHLAVAYWRLGQTLDLAKKNFNYGQWEGFLKTWKIDKTRASRARAIFRTFGGEEQVRSLTVEQAYGQR